MMIAVFAVLALLALTSGVRGERPPLFLKRMLPKWAAVALVVDLLALGLLEMAPFAPLDFVIIAIGTGAFCGVLGSIFYIWGRAVHGAPKESKA